MKVPRLWELCLSRNGNLSKIVWKKGSDSIWVKAKAAIITTAIIRVIENSMIKVKSWLYQVLLFETERKTLFNELMIELKSLRAIQIIQTARKTLKELKDWICIILVSTGVIFTTESNCSVKAYDKIINIRIYSKNSGKYRKNNQYNRNKWKNKTKGTRRSTFPQCIFGKIRKSQIKHLWEARNFFFQICLQRWHTYIIKPKDIFGNRRIKNRTSL